MKKKFLLILMSLMFAATYAQQRIIGGNNTTIDQNPWQISMRGSGTYHILAARNQHICGGSILTPEWILTAAHCITNFNTGNVIGVNEITISAGITQRNDLITGQYRNVAQIIRHPNYNPATQENDVALIRITAPLNYNNDVLPIQLTDSAFDALPGGMARVTGWGNTLDGTAATPSNILQTLDMPIISNNSANNLNTGNVTVSNNMFALRLVNSGVSRGDSGGPATVLKSSQRFLIGCSSWGESPKDNKPTIYTRLFNYRGWISNNLQLPDITGNNLVCNTNSTYTLQNGTGNITWTASGNIQIVSQNNTSAIIRASNASTSGSGWLRATSNNGSTFTERLNVNQVEGQTPMSISIYSSSSNYIDVTINGGSGNSPYDWYVNNSFSRTTTGRTTTFYYTENSIRIEVRNQNTCGTGQVSAFFTGPIPGRYGYYRISPNPASTTITISKESATFGDFKSAEIGNSDVFGYQLIDLNNIEVMNGKGTFNNEKFDLDITALKKGLYILEIVSDKIKETHKIIKE
ncbi:trypsin-like serine protease [Maribacter sp.]|nr:trypsin-like serine protease [Maribacter sp.]HDZ03837.1 trypsin-like serine protease [Maribacter sp.]